MSEPPPLTIRDLLDLVETDYRLNRRRSLYSFRCMRRYLEVYFGKRPAAEITPRHIQAFKAHRADVDGASESTINHELCWLRRGFKLALEDGLIGGLPRIRAYPLGNRNARTDFIRPTDFERLLPELRHDVRDFVEFAYFSGWRLGEIRNLTWASVDGDEIRVAPGLTKEGRLSQRARARILPLRGRVALVIDRRRNVRHPSAPWVFHRGGKQIRDFRLQWKTACRRVGLNGVVPHALRRSFVRNAIDVGIDRDIVCQFTGHLTASMLTRYNIVCQRRLEDAAERLAEML